jgi:hypothetical protein
MGSLCSSVKDPLKDESSRKKTNKKATQSKKRSLPKPKAPVKQVSQQSLNVESHIVPAAVTSGAQRGSVVPAPPTKQPGSPPTSAAYFTDSDAERAGNPLVGSGGDRRGSLADSSTSLRIRLLKLEDTNRAQAARAAPVPREKRNRAKEERLHAWLDGAAARTTALLDPQAVKGFLQQQAAKAETLEEEARRATISSGSSLAADSDTNPKPSQQEDMSDG